MRNFRYNNEAYRNNIIKKEEVKYRKSKIKINNSFHSLCFPRLLINHPNII